MPIPHTVQMYLAAQRAPFDVIEHEPTVSSLRTASRAHIGATTLAKAVLVEDDLEQHRFLVAVLPASRAVDLVKLSLRAGRPLHLATEEDAAGVFVDCAAGALPPLGPAYGVETIWDDSLAQLPELYFEAGDHTHLVHLAGPDFLGLLEGCPHGAFSRPM